MLTIFTSINFIEPLVIFSKCILIFFIIRKIVSEFIHGKMKIWIVSLILTPVVYCITFGIAFYFIFLYYPNRNFDKTEWNNNIKKRYEYTQKIIQNKMLIGKTKQEVLNLLGNKNIDSTTEMISYNKDQWYYDIGNVPGLGNIDPNVLIVQFMGGKVIYVSQTK